ncbi:MAG: 4-hydroxyphenylacetate 3-hydroxylase N-terminal domain-containing protein [Acidimicrobiales bacterium]
MNVTFAGFAQDQTRWAGPDGVNDEGYENLVAFQRRLRREDLALTHTLVQPTIDKATDGMFSAHPGVPLHKVGETRDSIIVRGARVLATLAPFADENAVYPGAPLPADAPPEYALSFVVKMDNPGRVFLCRDSATRNLDPFDAPFSSRLDEQDAYCIFDNVEIPKSDVWIDAKPEVYNTVMFTSPWWPNIMQQTTVRALTKLEFIYGLALRMAQAVNDTSEKTLQLLGEIQTYVELTRSSLLIAEERMMTWESGNVTPEARALHPLRVQLPVWFVRVNEILKELGSSKLLATAARGQLDDPRIGPLLEESTGSSVRSCTRPTTRSGVAGWSTPSWPRWRPGVGRPERRAGVADQLGRMRLTRLRSTLSRRPKNSRTASSEPSMCSGATSPPANMARTSVLVALMVAVGCSGASSRNTAT